MVKILLELAQIPSSNDEIIMRKSDIIMKRNA